MNALLDHWRGKAFVVTGAARGQGAALALDLLRAGATVHVIDTMARDNPGWDALRAAGAGRLVEWREDVADPQAWERLAAAIRADGTPLHGLVNNAGIVGGRSTVTRTELSDWERVIAVNLTGSMLGIRALAPLMAPGAAIVNISSTTGMTGYHSAAYSSSKWALRGLTRSAALELAPRGIRVNCVCPGVVDTEMIQANSAFVAALHDIIPLQRMAQAGQIADVVLFLLGPQASYVTGADFAVDGGVTGGGIYWQVGRTLGVLGDGPTTSSNQGDKR
jgi:NAD(P)-dependent dehydrogenase (short-subunit alcohol dehydrogenase family)